MLRLAHCRRLSSTTRNKNFFEINPIHPKVGEQEYKLYGYRRHRISPLEHYTNTQYVQLEREHQLYRTLTKADSRLSDKQAAHKIILDAYTFLPYGMGFDSYIYAKKGYRTIRKVDRNYSNTISKLINKLKLRSEPELVRFFRLALADQRKDDIKEQIKGVVLKNLVLEASRSKNSDVIRKFIKNPYEVKDNKTPHFEEEALESKAFELALAQIDSKIEQVEINLNIHQRASLSTTYFNPNFKKYDDVLIDEPSLDTDINFDRKPLRVKNVPKNFANKQDFQDAMIERRISRLYFLKRLELERSDSNIYDITHEFVNETIEYFKIVNPVDFEMKVQYIARRYNIEYLIPTHTEYDIYKELELFVNNLKVDVKTAPRYPEKNQPKLRKGPITLEDLADPSKDAPPQSEYFKEEEVPDSLHFYLRNPQELLWRNLNVTEIFDGDAVFANLQIKVADEEKHPFGHLEEDIDRTKEIIVSPNADLEVSLNTLPYNLYKHSDFLIFGLYNDQMGDLSLEQVGSIMEPTVDPRHKYPRFQFENPTKLYPRPVDIKEDYRVEFYAGGKRKTCKALCRIRSGTGMIKVNRQNIRDYFPDTYHRAEMLKPLLFSGTSGYVDVDIFVSGGGLTAQTEAACLALVKALIKYRPRLKGMFRQAGLVTQDPRFVERKHSGRYKARKGYVYVRR